MKTIKLLLVDDDVLFSDVVKQVLTSAGLQVTTAKSLDKARDVMQQNKFDFVLLDLVLADGPGTALVPDLRKAHIPFRYFSRFTEEEAVCTYGTQVEGLVLDKGTNGVRMDLLTRIYDHIRPKGAFA